MELVYVVYDTLLKIYALYDHITHFVFNFQYEYRI
jgi:hypothetical protein